MKDSKIFPMIPTRFRLKRNCLMILLFVSFVLLKCSSHKPEEEERVSLYLLLLNNPGEPQTISIVEIRLRDINSYEGTCLDTFFGITAGAYLNVHYPPEVRDFPFRKVRGSQQSCSRLGFPGGGAENRIDGRSVSFRSYTCGPQTSLCSRRAIREAGFSD